MKERKKTTLASRLLVPNRANQTPETAKARAYPAPPRHRLSISRIASATEGAAAESNARRPPARPHLNRRIQEETQSASTKRRITGSSRRADRRRGAPGWESGSGPGPGSFSPLFLQLRRGEGGLKKRGVAEWRKKGGDAGEGKDKL